MLLNIFQYDFILRGLIAGIIIALTAPVVGTFLVLRRYSLIADTLSHVSLAGVAIGLFLQINPLITAIAASVASSVFIERLRLSKRVYGESACQSSAAKIKPLYSRDVFTDSEILE